MLYCSAFTLPFPAKGYLSPLDDCSWMGRVVLVTASGHLVGQFYVMDSHHLDLQLGSWLERDPQLELFEER